MIRPAIATDLPEILAIYNEVILAGLLASTTIPVTLADRQAWFEERQAAGYPVLVAEIDEVIVGFSTFGDWRGKVPGYQGTVEHTVHVQHNVRGQGVGRQLVEALFPRARALGKHVMVGATAATNTASLEFHRRLGFERVAHFRNVGRNTEGLFDLIFFSGT